MNKIKTDTRRTIGMDTKRTIVLVVDDERKYFDMYESALLLKDEKHDALTKAIGDREIVPLYACSYEEAVSSLEMHAGQSPEGSCRIGDVGLVITDFGISEDYDGNDVAKFVKQNFPHIPVVGNTGGSPENFDKAHVNAAFAKIGNRDTLLNVVYKYAKRM